ncbi:MAG TPA: rhodanese-like domain-containing protein [Saprospiraceae bacterium]|nr:rhodanese-like domain-containing protein [Saprospiraceae bacterium]
MKFSKSIIPFISLILLLSLGTSCKKSGDGKPEDAVPENKVENAAPALEPQDFQDEMKRSGAVIVDIRFPAEYEQGHIDGAININFFDGKFKDNILALDRSKKYLLYSKADSQTKRAGIFMRENGFTDVVVMKGGWEAWKESQKK